MTRCIARTPALLPAPVATRSATFARDEEGAAPPAGESVAAATVAS